MSHSYWHRGGDRFSYMVAVDRQGEIVAEEGRVATTRKGVAKYFARFGADARIVCEAGTHSQWVSALLEDLGFEVIVANPCQAGRALAANSRKNDRLDAITLATLGVDSVRLLRPIKHRSRAAQEDLSVIRARDAAIRMRSLAINTIRGLVKTNGERLPKCSSASFHRKVLEAVPSGLKAAVLPLIEQIGQLTTLVRSYDKQIDELCEKYPETQRLRQIKGVGPLIAMAFVLTLEDAKRFKRSRDVGPYLGLVPGQRESGASSPQLRITKEGDKYLRQLLVNGAHYVLGPFGPDCELRRFGKRVGARGGGNGKKRAVTAVARKLAVLMHRLWSTGDTYEPFHQSKQERKSA